MKKFYLTILSSFIIGIFIFFSSIIISRSINNNTPEQPRYQLVSHGNEIIIFDTKTGKYYAKFDDNNSGPTNWTKEDNPFDSQNNK